MVPATSSTVGKEIIQKADDPIGLSVYSMGPRPYLKTEIRPDSFFWCRMRLETLYGFSTIRAYQMKRTSESAEQRHTSWPLPKPIDSVHVAT